MEPRQIFIIALLAASRSPQTRRPALSAVYSDFLNHVSSARSNPFNRSIVGHARKVEAA